MKATVLVTGATGFLGRHVLRALTERGIRPALLVRQRAQWLAQPWRGEVGDVDIVEGDLRSFARAQGELSEVRTILHLAGIVRHSRSAPEEMQEVNVQGTLQMVRLAHELGARLIFASSSGTVGCFRFADMMADEDAPYAEPTVARWPYYMSKIRAERQARRLSEQLGSELVIVRPPVLLGPDDHRHRSTAYVKRVLDGKVPVVPPGGMHFTDVRDVARAFVRLAEIEKLRPVYHLPGTASTTSEFFQMVTDVSGATFKRRPISRGVALALARVIKIGQRFDHSLPDPVLLEMSTCFWGLNSLFAHELDYQPRSARQTLSDTVSWLRGEQTQSAEVSARDLRLRWT